MSLLALALILASCSGDDDGDNGATADLTGSWTLTSYTFDEAVDVNLDGTPSTDFFAELPCYMSSATFVADGTFTSATSEIDIDIDIVSGTVTVDCAPAVSLTGTWELNGDQLTTTAEGETDTETVELTATTLTFDIVDPEFGAATWVWTRN